MKKVTKKTPLHINIRQKLLDYIYGEGVRKDKLPSERDLALDLKVSRSTLRKAISQLTREEIIINHPRSGNYISGIRPPRRIGIINTEGEFAALIPNSITLSGELKTLGEAGCLPSFLYLGEITEQELMKHNMDAIIWNDPPASAIPLILNIIEKRKLPLVVLSLMFSTEAEELWRHIKKNIVSLDYNAVGDMRAEYFISRGCKKVIYLGNHKDAPTLKKFKSAFNSAGNKFKEEWHIMDVFDIPEKLPPLLDSGERTGIISNGGAARQENLFRILQEHPEPEKFILYLDYINGIEDLLLLYPRVKVSVFNTFPYFEMGKAAAETLIKQFDNALPEPQICFNSCMKTPDGASVNNE